MPDDGATAPPADLMPVIPGYESFGPNGENNFSDLHLQRRTKC